MYSRFILRRTKDNKVVDHFVMIYVKKTKWNTLIFLVKSIKHICKNLFPGMLFLDQYVDKLSDCQYISLKNLDYYFRTYIDLGRRMLTH